MLINNDDKLYNFFIHIENIKKRQFQYDMVFPDSFQPYLLATVDVPEYGWKIIFKFRKYKRRSTVTSTFMVYDDQFNKVKFTFNTNRLHCLKPHISRTLTVRVIKKRIQKFFLESLIVPQLLETYYD